MAPLPPDGTARLYVTYATVNAEHSIENRYDESLMSPDDAVVDTAFLFESMTDFFYAITIVKAEYSVLGSNIRLPVTWSGSTTYGADPEPVVHVPRQWTITGKSDDGRRWKSTLFGLKQNPPDNWKAGRAPGGFVDTWLIAVGSTAADWLSISGGSVIFNQVATVNENDGWIDHQRTG